MTRRIVRVFCSALLLALTLISLALPVRQLVTADENGDAKRPLRHLADGDAGPKRPSLVTADEGNHPRRPPIVIADGGVIGAKKPLRVTADASTPQRPTRLIADSGPPARRPL